MDLRQIIGTFCSVFQLEGVLAFHPGISRISGFAVFHLKRIKKKLSVYLYNVSKMSFMGS